MRAPSFQMPTAVLAAMAFAQAFCGPNGQATPSPATTIPPSPMPVSSTSTPPPVPTTAPTWTTYGIEDGLPTDDVTALAVAPDGSVWIGTFQGGAAHFDGVSWTTYAQEDGLAFYSSIEAVGVGPGGFVWVGTDNGLYRFDGRIWLAVAEENSPGLETVLGITVAPDGSLWMGSYSIGPGPRAGIPALGCAYSHGAAWTRYTTADGLVNDSVRSIAIAQDGSAWFATDGGVSHFDGRTWTNYTEQDGLASNGAHAVAIAPDGLVWFATEMGISRFDGAAWTTYTSLDGLPGDVVWSVAVAPDGALWFGFNTNSDGVARFDGSTWSTYTREDGLAGSGVTDIAVTPDGALWFSTRTGGVSRYLPPQ